MTRKGRHDYLCICTFLYFFSGIFACASPSTDVEAQLVDQVIAAAKVFKEADPEIWTKNSTVDFVSRLQSRNPEIAMQGLFEIWLAGESWDIRSTLKWYRTGKHERATRVAIIALFECYETDAGKPNFANESMRFAPLEQAQRTEEVLIVKRNLKKFADAFSGNLSKNRSRSPHVKMLMEHFHSMPSSQADSPQPANGKPSPSGKGERSNN